MGNVPFSARYKEITNVIELWRAVITKNDTVNIAKANCNNWKK
jgi:hypothetical protein